MFHCFPTHIGTPIPGTTFLTTALELPYSQAIVMNSGEDECNVNFCSSLAFYSLNFYVFFQL